MVIWNILRPFGIIYGHFGKVVVIWYIFPRFGILHQEKSGNPAHDLKWTATKNERFHGSSIFHFSDSFRGQCYGF
jgi:hypothetical protein